MKKPLFWIIVFLFSAISANSQTIKGVITDEDDVKLKNVQISLSGINLLWFTDANGRFEIPNLPDSNYRLTAVLNGFDTLYTDFDKRQNSNLRIVMISSAFLQEAASIKVYRAKYTTPIAYQNLSREAINRNNLGQDLPILLNVTPSAVATSDAGAGIGYTGLRIRGSDGTRINVTVNGIPLNDAESQGVYWVNMPDFSSSLGSVQIQRGVGTSTNGTGAFGASINLQSTTPDTAAYGEFNNTFGSFNTIKNTLKIGTGTINKFWNFNGRISRIVSDGYIDRASSSLQSYYFSGRYSKKKTVVEAITFGGSEKTYQSWYGTPESRLNNDSNAMIEHAANNNYTEAQKNNLLNAGRTYNYYLYSNETDNYKQNHYQLLSTHAFSKKFSGNAALHYTRGQGYYEQSKQGQNFSDYGVRNTITTNDTITHTDLIRRRWLDNHFYGAIGSLSYSVKKLKVIAGGGWNVYRGRHFGKVIWAEFADNLPYDYRYYLSHSYKRDANAYIKGEFTASKKLNIFGDLQIRSVKYSGNGTDQDNVIIDFGKTYLFFNPKGGVSYSVNSKNILYGSLSIANREPVRGD
ncbi:MAG: TonB-dependent receptor, partial [Bacteroidia bacterium]|nr:TonB-dependent receptor [Bacteroidia bacterium]